MTTKRRTPRKHTTHARDDTGELLTLRVPASMLERAEALVPHLVSDATVVTAGSVTRSTVLRLALAEGLRHLERRYRQSP